MNQPRTLTIGGPSAAQLSSDGRTMIVTIPIKLRHAKGRKLMMMTSDAATIVPLRPAAHARVDSTLVKAVVRAHRWRALLESEKFATVRDLAEAEKINESYVCRMLRLTLLSPAIVEAILDGSQHEALELSDLLEKLPSEWDAQAAFIAGLH